MIQKPLYTWWWFDIMHSSHKKFILRCIEKYKEVYKNKVKSIIIWLNSDLFLNSYKWENRPFFGFDWRKEEMENFLKTLDIWFSVVESESMGDLNDFVVAVRKWSWAEKKRANITDLISVPEIWWAHHTSSVEEELFKAKDMSLCKMIKIWSILLRDWEIINMGYNGSLWSDNCEKEKIFYWEPIIDWKRHWLSRSVSCNSPHSEIMAIKNVKKWDDLIITKSPCLDCAIEIAKKWIRRVVFLEEYYDWKAWIDHLIEKKVQVRKAWVIPYKSLSWDVN